MFNKIPLFTSLFLLVTNAQADVVPYTFFVSTYINKSLLFPSEIYITAKPDRINLKFDPELRKFSEVKSMLDISTNIPEKYQYGYFYNLSVISNTSSCNSFPSQGVTQVGVMNLTLEGNPFSSFQPATGLPFELVDKDGFINSQKTLTLMSQKIDDNVYKCQGEIALEVELGL